MDSILSILFTYTENYKKSPFPSNLYSLFSLHFSLFFCSIYLFPMSTSYFHSWDYKLKDVVPLFQICGYVFHFFSNVVYCFSIISSIALLTQIDHILTAVFLLQKCYSNIHLIGVAFLELLTFPTCLQNIAWL